MKKCKKILNRLLFPPFWVILLLVLFSITSFVLLSVKEWADQPISYAIYALATYTLTVFCVFAVKLSRDIYKKVRQDVYENPLGNRYMTDAAFKVKVSLLGSLAINFAYSIFKLVTGIIYSSFCIALAACSVAAADKIQRVSGQTAGFRHSAAGDGNILAETGEMNVKLIHGRFPCYFLR